MRRKFAREPFFVVEEAVKEFVVDSRLVDVAHTVARVSHIHPQQQWQQHRQQHQPQQQSINQLIAPWLNAISGCKWQLAPSSIPRFEMQQHPQQHLQQHLQQQSINRSVVQRNFKLQMAVGSQFNPAL